MVNPVGRPMKYRNYIAILEDKVVYSPATIVDHGEANGLMNPNLNQEQRKKERLRIRHTLARFSSNHNFPTEGDGVVHIKGQTPLRGWFGWRWKKATPK